MATRSYDYDYFVIGGGSGGVRSARIAAQHGARVGLAEERYLGGTCVNVGCVPKKLLAYAAHFAHDIEDAAGFGWHFGRPHHDWKKLIAAKDKEIGRLNGIYRRLLEGAGVEIFDDRATFLDQHTLKVGDRQVTAERILIAVGGWPNLPEEPGAKEHGITSNEVFFLEEMPKRVLIAGGGYIAVEFASIFHGLGAEVCQLYRGELFLRGFDDDVRMFLAEEMAKAGVDLRFNTIITRIGRSHDCLVAELSDGATIETDAVIYAIGRTPNTSSLGLDKAGVKVAENGAIPVGEDFSTNRPHIYAIGDVIDRVQLTPVAIAEGHVLADTLFGGMADRSVDYTYIPTAVFSTPEIGTVGLSETAARSRYPAGIDIYRTSFKPLKHTLSGRDAKMMMKLLVERASQRVVGCHIVGDDAGEMVQSVAIAINVGATKADFDRTIGIHPTSAEELVTMRVKAPDPELEEAAE
ncbi:MAG: glutathione-disulfide reductase [Azospirillaceae bacterium]